MSGSTRKHDSEVLQHSAQYVRAGGWSAMARVVRDFDEEKVKDCKEDIDTLLVFAGLFSAVLSAFLVGSYPLLQQDTPGQILLTLDKIYQAQIGGGPASSPAVSQPEPFVPSTSAVRVNVLWFSSLIISLTTASFGMLVKQWLREYLAVENPSPQARLRIRHFREPELTRWAVFEIAAVLPVLLQLSLGLFFIGLCYFTSMVHPSIGNTSLPLVAGWAFCFLTVTILPVFFPRCPYKTTLLKKALTTAHQGGATVVAKFFEVDAVQSNDELLETTIAESLDQASPEWPAAISFLSHVLRNRLGLHPPNVCFTDLGSLTKRGRDAVVNILLRYTSKISLLDRDWNSDERRAVSTAFSVLLAYSDSDGLSETGWSVMCECLTNGGKTLCRPFGKLFQSQPENSNFDYTDSLPSIFFSRLSAALTQLGLDLDVALTHLEAVANGYMEGHRTLENILADDDLHICIRPSFAQSRNHISTVPQHRLVYGQHYPAHSG
ncbi:hypothetical protein BC835DRAFT_946113 [Cytidiella melzeri]|nr:hypothetical protein BC835DRAFT_946113 [Cytidiella melzeri]